MCVAAFKLKWQCLGVATKNYKDLNIYQINGPLRKDLSATGPNSLFNILYFFIFVWPTI